MYYFLNYEYGLRRYNDAEYCIVKRFDKYFFMPITEKEFEVLREASIHNISDDDKKYTSIIEKFALRQILLPDLDGQHIRCDNWNVKICYVDYHPEMEVAITQKCNYNCQYCFEAADVNKMTDEFSLEEFNTLLQEARDCGINCIAITGGEPMIHKHFMNFIWLARSYNIGISEILTNGSMITDEILDKLLGCPACVNTVFRISFDGFHGKHNILRETQSDNIVVENIKKCVTRGFQVKVTYNLNEFNKAELKNTARVMDEIGIAEFRVVRTMPSRKLRALGMEDTILSHNGWINASLDFALWYMANVDGRKLSGKMHIDFWNVYYLNPTRKLMTLNTIKGCGNKKIDDKLILCPLTKSRICICGDGAIVPCHQISGGLKKQGIDLGNVKRDGLYSILEDSKWKDLINTKVTERLKHQEKCKNCEYWDMCLGGCPVIGAPWRWEYGEKFPFSTDVTQCAFFEGGYLDIFKKEVTSRGWHLPIFFGMPLPSFDTPGRTRMELKK